MDLFGKVIADFEALLSEESLRLDREGGLPLGRPEVKVLGQMSLLLDPEAGRHLRLAATGDVDAHFVGNMTALQLFREALKANDLVYDEVSSEIWLPRTHRFELVHDSHTSLVTRLDTFSVLVSKANKAPEKNKFLIEQALGHYGQALEKQFRDNQINLNQFKYQKSKGRRL